MPPRFLRTYPPAQPIPGTTIWLPFQGSTLLVREQADGIALAIGDASTYEELGATEPMYLGLLDGLPCLAFDVAPDREVPAGWQAIGLRGLFGRLSEEEYTLAGYASQMLYWRRTSTFCPVCGGTTEQINGDWGKRCTQCGHTRYPLVSPAILVLVYNEHQILLTHKTGWGPMYSIIAGFVEPGESLEECVQREIREEVGLEVTDVVYRGNQAWPFPHQLMIGFTARYVSGEPTPDLLELDEARWFNADAMPALPQPISLSRQLIDEWMASKQPAAND